MSLNIFKDYQIARIETNFLKSPDSESGKCAIAGFQKTSLTIETFDLNVKLLLKASDTFNFVIPRINHQAIGKLIMN